MARMGDGMGADISAQTGTTDSLAFEVGDEINIEADLENFAPDKGSLKDDTTASATLKANNTTNEAKAKYNLFFIIDKNDFTYTTEDNKAELVVRVTDPKDNEVTAIEGLKKVENGFDITTRVGSFLIAADYEIETTSTETQKWKLEVELVNLDSDQNANQGKVLNGRFYITTEQAPTYELAEINTLETNISANSIEAILNYKKGSAENDKYYFAIEEKTDNLAYVSTGNMVARLANTTNQPSYIESSEPRYKFNNLKLATAYKIYSYIVDGNGISSGIYTAEITTGEYQLPVVKNMSYKFELDSIKINVTAVDGTNETVRYHYSIGDGNFVSSTESTYTFTDLTDTTTYKIKVKVEDSEGRFSTIYEKYVDTKAYVNPMVTTVTSTSTHNSITLTASAEKGTTDIMKYYFKKSTDSNWIEQTSSTYTFTDLTDATNYAFDIKVSDTLGRESMVYKTTSISTNAYILPTVTATTSAMGNNITVNATGTNGTGTITKYMYKKDGQSDWTTVDSTSTTNSYTFSDITPGVSFNIYVKVIDSNGRESNEYITLATSIKLSPNLTLTRTSASATTAKVSYTYDGDGTISCTGSNGVTCSAASGTITINFNGKIGNIDIPVSVSEGTNHLPQQDIISIKFQCVAEDTLVDAWDKKRKKKLKKKIKDIEEGDIVYTYDYNTKTYVTRKVKKVIINKAKEIYHLFIGGEEIKITADHEICVEGLGYIKTSLLKVGYKVLGQDGKLFEIEKIEIENCAKEHDMYCLELEDGSSFMIGKNGLVCLAMFVSSLAVMYPKNVRALTMYISYGDPSAYVG
ncbi:MAG: hypothetical protein K2M17_00140 [Bacilli bacterium]|nr:hypothetical protein [Bacilli bacterium]